MSDGHDRVDPENLLAALRAQAHQTNTPAWLVGGAVRDRILARPQRSTLDYDLAVEGDPRSLARALGRAADGHAFQLSEQFGAWRVRGRSAPWQIDLTPLLGETLEQDLYRRDLTINAIACELEDDRLIDPFGGAADLAAQTLRAVADTSFSADPLRVLRLARFVAELGFSPEQKTERLACSSAVALADVPGERAFQELRQLVCAAGVMAGLDTLDRIGGTQAVLPELHALRGVDQSHYHHLDVYDHTLATLGEVVDIDRDPEPSFGASAPELSAVLSEPLANEMTRGQALRFGALMHDIGKPVTRAVTPEGRVTFFGHDEAGASLSTEILTRLRASEKLIVHVAALARDHLRLGFLVHERPLTARARYHYLSACDPVEVDVTVLSVADRLATRGRNADAAVTKHLELARELMPEALRFRRDPPRVPIRGDELARQLGIAPGPRLGELLGELTEAVYTGEVVTAEEAVAHAREQAARLDADG